MSDLGLSDAERRYVARVASADRSGGQRLAFYAAMLSPMFAFGIYGLFRGDLVALAIAFAGLAFFLIWRIAQEMKSAPLYFSVFSKIEALESTQTARSRAVSPHD